MFPIYHDEIIEKTTQDKIEKLNVKMKKYDTYDYDIEQNEEYELSI
ncbi:MAG: hypothetical protein RR847_05625 [Bacilli bacterium]